jgi:shikimate kinase
MLKSNLVLIGMPGAGKSTLGVLLAKTLGKNFIDTDLLVQESERRLLREIIAADGVAGFLRIEERVLLGLTAANAVIATGGSAVYSGPAMRRLREDGLIIYLKLPMRRLSGGSPIWRSGGLPLAKGSGCPICFWNGRSSTNSMRN